MNLSRAIYITILLLGVHSVAMAQVDSVDSAALDTVSIDSVVSDSLDPSQIDTSESEGKKLFKVVPWEFHSPLDAQLVATDSTLRWQIWPDWTYRLNREPGIITYRLGTNIRSNAVQRHAHEPRHQQLYWEDISLNDPVSGSVNWSLIPQNKIARFYEQDLGTEHRSTFYLHQYYLNKPLSRLLYDESKFSYRNLEFEVSHNLSQRTNVEISYWDRRSGGEYSNSSITGRQIYAKASHNLDERRYLKLDYMNNSLDVGQPFGYNIPNLLNFNFDRFSTVANQSSSVSNETHSLLSLHFYQRSADSTQSVDNFHAGLFYRGAERILEYSADSTGYSLGSVGANARKWWSRGRLSMEAGAGYEQFFNGSSDNNSLVTGDWGLLNAEGRFSLDLPPIIGFHGGAELKYRTDGFQGYRLNATADFKIGSLTLSPGASAGSILPTPQQLYWSSAEFSGSENLSNETIQEVRGTLNYQAGPGTNFGIRAQHKGITDGIMLQDSSFVNVTNYASQSATAFFEWDLEHFEFNGSATVHRFTDSYTSPDDAIPMSSKERFWLKGGAYWKGYLFDRATYVKAGVSGMMAPFRYQADHYNPVLDYWQAASNDQQLPLFNRLDVDISARVRSIIVVLRWENVLDDVYELGYFETAQYPMMQRRFIFGIRALFRN